MHIEKFNEDKKVWKGTDFWIDEIKKVGVYDQLVFFNDVVTENHPPHPESGFHKVISDILLDGVTCDIYHTDQDEAGNPIRGNSWNRIFIHKK